MWKSLCRKTDLVLVMRAWDGQRNHQYCGWLDHWWMWYACCLPYVRLIWLKKKEQEEVRGGSMYVIVCRDQCMLLYTIQFWSYCFCCQKLSWLNGAMLPVRFLWQCLHVFFVTSPNSTPHIAYHVTLWLWNLELSLAFFFFLLLRAAVAVSSGCDLLIIYSQMGLLLLLNEYR